MLADYLSHVATVYLQHSHEPDNVTVREAYETLKRELVEQYRMLSRGLTIEHTDCDPYIDSCSMFEDIRTNRRLRVYTHSDIPHNHPLNAMAFYPETPRTFNDVFRAVHDGLAHYPGRHSFGTQGEYRAYLAHCTYLSPLARWAVFTETVAQFAVYKSTGTYAPQRATLLPRELVELSFNLEV